jgi:hypothetical protein
MFSTMQWTCSCGNVNTGVFCARCGGMHHELNKPHRSDRLGTVIARGFLLAVALGVGVTVLIVILVAIFGGHEVQSPQISAGAPSPSPSQPVKPAPPAQPVQEPPQPAPPVRPTLTGTQLADLQEEQQSDRDEITTIERILSTKSPIDAVNLYCRFTVLQTEHLSELAASRPIESQKAAVMVQQFTVCRNRILYGGDRLPSAERFREYEAKAKEDLDQIEQQLKDAEPEPSSQGFLPQ